MSGESDVWCGGLRCCEEEAGHWSVCCSAGDLRRQLRLQFSTELRSSSHTYHKSFTGQPGLINADLHAVTVTTRAVCVFVLRIRLADQLLWIRLHNNTPDKFQ